MTAEAPKGKGGRFENIGRRVDQRLGGTVPRLEEEVSKIIDLLDSQVVPSIRKNSSAGLRSAAERLRRLADRLDRAEEPGVRPPGEPSE